MPRTKTHIGRTETVRRRIERQRAYNQLHESNNLEKRNTIRAALQTERREANPETEALHQNEKQARRH